MARPLTAKTARAAPGFTAEIRLVWRAFLRALRDPYRPECFYMRGPGPRWRAKNGLAAA